MFMADISIIVRKMRIFAERRGAQLDVGFPEQLVLMHLKAHGSSNQESIAGFLDVDKGAIAKTVAKLEEKGLIIREINTSNRREKLVALQPAAEEVLTSMALAYEEFEKTMFAGLSAQEKEQAIQLVQHIARNISEV